MPLFNLLPWPEIPISLSQPRAKINICIYSGILRVGRVLREFQKTQGVCPEERHWGKQLMSITSCSGDCPGDIVKMFGP